MNGSAALLLGRFRSFIGAAPLTTLVMSACSTMLAVMLARGGVLPGLIFDRETQEHFGALVPARVWANGELWRLLSACIVHLDPLHFTLDMLALIFLGPAVERIFGPLRSVLLFFGAQLACSATSLCFGDMDTRLGASGLACGMMGALLVAQIRGEHPAPSTFRRNLFGWIVLVLVWSLFSGVDLLGHLGGLLGGITLAVGLEPSPTSEQKPNADPNRDRDRERERALSLFFALALLGVELRFAIWQPERADWNAARAYELRHQDRCAEAVPYFRQAADRNYGDYLPATLHAALGECLVELGERDAGFAELGESIEQGSVEGALYLGGEEEEPHRRILDFARALALEPTDSLSRKELLRELIFLADEGDLPTSADLAPLENLPRRDELEPVELAKATAVARDGKLGPLESLSQRQPLAKPILDGFLHNDGGTTAPVAEQLSRVLLAMNPGIDKLEDADATPK
jgi:rhomboid protease GluP